MSDTSDYELSDDDEVKVIEWRKYSLPFGKHRGTMLGPMIRTGNGRNYLRYLLEWDDLRPETKAVITQAMDHYSTIRDPNKKRKKKRKHEDTNSK
jgi:hypothetical protein